MENRDQQVILNNIKKDTLFTSKQRLDALNLKIDPKNPEGTKTQSLVNLIANLIANLGWYEKQKEIEKVAKPLTELQQLGKKLNKAEKQFKEQFKGKDKEANKAFAKYTCIELSLTKNSDNQDIIDSYLQGKRFSDTEIREAKNNTETQDSIRDIKKLIEWQEKEYLDTINNSKLYDKDLEKEKFKEYLKITKGYLPVKEYGEKVEKFLPNESERLDALNLKIDPKNPTKKGRLDINEESLVNGINAVPIISDLFEFNDNWNAKKQNMEDRTALLEPLAKTGKLLKKIEDKYKDKNGVFIEGKYKDKNGVFIEGKYKKEFAKSAINILSRDDNKDLLEKYLDLKGFSETEIAEAITDVNKAKHILLTGKDFNKNITIQNPTQESGKKQFIQALGYKTEAELELMGLKETNDCVEILGKDFGFTLGDKGEIKYEKPKTQSKNYRNELESANNINNKLQEKLDYSEQNTESEEQKAEEEANNQNYSRTSTNTPQSGMSAKKMAGNAVILGGAIASAAAIPFVGWIVALAILYSFKDKFKDDPKANEEFENAAKSNGLKNDELQKLKNEVAQLKERELKKTTNPQDHIIKDLGKYLGENPDRITDILTNKNNKKELKDFLVTEVYNSNPTNKQKKAIEDLINSDNINKTVDEVIKNIQESQKSLGKNVTLKKDKENTTQIIHQK